MGIAPTFLGNLKERELALKLAKGLTMRYAIVVEKTENNYSAYVPDLPGCVATGSTVEETEREIREAIEFHIEGLVEDGLPIPQPSSIVEYLEIAACLPVRT